VLDVERWAELRREHFVRVVPIKELVRRTALAWNTGDPVRLRSLSYSTMSQNMNSPGVPGVAGSSRQPDLNIPRRSERGAALDALDGFRQQRRTGEVPVVTARALKAWTFSMRPGARDCVVTRSQAALVEKALWVAWVAGRTNILMI
jgi:hypothetical protein